MLVVVTLNRTRDNFLLKSLRRDQPLHVVEIGVACGQNAGHFLKCARHLKYFA